MRTSQQRNSAHVASQLDVVRDEVALQRRARTQRRVPQFLEVDERLVAIDEFRAACRLSERTRRLRQAKETVELGQDTDRAKPDAAVRVELGEETVLELLDGRVAVLAGLLELPDRWLQSRDDITFGGLRMTASVNRRQ